MSLESKMKINLIETKSIITKSSLPDADFVINPYVGCQHACIYCYADFMKRFTGHNGEDWGEFIDVKINSAQTIKRPNFKEKTILLGSVTDPYQPAESKYKITQQILQKLLPFQPNLEILTKSALVYRDVEILEQFENLKVGISLNTLNPEISKKLEPYATTPKGRINTLQRLHSNGIKTYLFISPIFPEITDYKKIISETRNFVDEVLFENLNIRANNKSKILSFISNYKPDLIPLYQNLQNDSNYWNELEQEISDYCVKNKIKFKTYFRHGGSK